MYISTLCNILYLQTTHEQDSFTLSTPPMYSRNMTIHILHARTQVINPTKRAQLHLESIIYMFRIFTWPIDTSTQPLYSLESRQTHSGPHHDHFISPTQLIHTVSKAPIDDLLCSPLNRSYPGTNNNQAIKMKLKTQSTKPTQHLHRSKVLRRK